MTARMLRSMRRLPPRRGGPVRRRRRSVRRPAWRTRPRPRSRARDPSAPTLRSAPRTARRRTPLSGPRETRRSVGLPRFPRRVVRERLRLHRVRDACTMRGASGRPTTRTRPRTHCVGPRCPRCRPRCHPWRPVASRSASPAGTRPRPPPLGAPRTPARPRGGGRRARPAATQCPRTRAPVRRVAPPRRKPRTRAQSLPQITPDQVGPRARMTRADHRCCARSARMLIPG